MIRQSTISVLPGLTVPFKAHFLLPDSQLQPLSYLLSFLYEQMLHPSPRLYPPCQEETWKTDKRSSLPLPPLRPAPPDPVWLKH